MLITPHSRLRPLLVAASALLLISCDHASDVLGPDRVGGTYALQPFFGGKSVPVIEFAGRCQKPAGVTTLLADADLRITSGSIEMRYEGQTTGPDGHPRYYGTLTSTMHISGSCTFSDATTATLEYDDVQTGNWTENDADVDDYRVSFTFELPRTEFAYTGSNLLGGTLEGRRILAFFNPSTIEQPGVLWEIGLTGYVLTYEK